MHTVALKLVTVITERLLRDRIVDELRKCGAKGFTVSDVSGEGSRGVRASEWEGQNLRIESVVSPDVADRVVERIADDFFENYAVIVYLQDVEVVRGDKYV
ncbi:MAG TPA: P-II family nitrogen regulator [Candidatus Krumholzibacteria bacterium]|nr:P-II family nitrogen regulator [Candidatus Krumholzibacteria bacterium]